jgi:vacuolar protein sorting-associated protein 45
MVLTTRWDGQLHISRVTNSNLQSVQELVMKPTIQPYNKLRLVMLYALRYQKQASGNIATLISALKEQGVSAEEAQVGESTRRYLLDAYSL